MDIAIARIPAASTARHKMDPKPGPPHWLFTLLF